jgi:hypothetical protein
MRIVERKVSSGDREIFDLDEFLSRPLYGHLAHDSGHGPRDSPVWFHWDGQDLWMIGGARSKPKGRRPRYGRFSAQQAGLLRRFLPVGLFVLVKRQAVAALLPGTRVGCEP